MALFVTTCRFRDHDTLWTATLVAEATSAEEVDDLARNALAHQALEYIDCAPPRLLSEGHAPALVRSLAQSITADAPIQFSQPYAAKGAPPVALHAAVIALTVPDPEDKTPFWDRPWCPPELHALAFEGELRSYLLLDADKYVQIAHDFDVGIIAGMHKIENLYNGETAQDLRDVAPYLVDVTLDASGPTKFHRDFIKQHWGKGTGVFLRSNLDFAGLRKHLRGFTRIRSSDTAKGWTLFRFWDPLVARIYFQGLDQRPDRVAHFFGIAPTTLEFLIEHGAEAVLHLWPADMPAHDPAERRLPLVFDAADHALMDQVVLAGLGQGLVNWLAHDHPDQFADFTPDQFGRLAHHILTQGQRFGCVTKDDFSFFGQMMLTLGGWFHHSATPAPLVEVIRTAGARRTALQPLFMPAYADTAQAVLVTKFAEVHAYLAALPQDEAVSSSQFRAFYMQFLADKGVARASGWVW